MSDPLKAMLQTDTFKANLFPPNSRYYGLETATLETEEGQTVIFVRRRLVPSSDQFELVQMHRVADGERLDNITAQYLGDPELFWRLCDANDVLHPNELEEFDRKIRITLPQDISGATS